MAEEAPVVDEALAVNKDPVVLVNGVEYRTIKEMILYKMDRTIAVVGIVLLGCWALSIKTPESVQITMAAIGGLVGYVGGRTSK